MEQTGNPRHNTSPPQTPSPHQNTVPRLKLNTLAKRLNKHALQDCLQITPQDLQDRNFPHYYLTAPEEYALAQNSQAKRHIPLALFLVPMEGPDNVYGYYDYQRHAVDLFVQQPVWPVPPIQRNGLYYRTLQIVRHELQHATQTPQQLLYANQLPAFPQESLDYYNYYLPQDAETEAYVHSIYQTAQLQRSSVSNEINNVLQDFEQYLVQHGANPNQTCLVVELTRWKWTQYAYQQFPKAQQYDQPRRTPTRSVPT